MSAPRVTVAIPTRNRAAFLREAIASALAQTFDDIEVLVCDNASEDDTAAVVGSFADPRLRYERNDRDLGMVGNWNRCIELARGELIANLADDDLMTPDRLARQVAIFDADPEAAVVHGDAEMIDATGHAIGSWAAQELDPGALLHVLVRHHNILVWPSTTIHRRVFDALGGYAEGYRIAADLDLWLRAVPAMCFRHTPGGAVVRFRRHESAGSREDNRALEVEEVERALAAAVERLGAAALVPEADGDERLARLRLADLLEERTLPLPGLARSLRDQALEGRPRIMLTSFGYNDSGGGTIVPRQLSGELVRRGWDVTVFHAAVQRLPDAPPYAVRRWYEDGVRLIGVHNRPHGLFDLGNPQREIDDPPITAAFAEALDRHRPQVVHVHNLHNLGAALLDEIAERGIPAHYSTHNYWPICPRAYLYTERLELCQGPGDGSGCATCVGSPDRRGHRQRLIEIRSRFERGLTSILAVSEAMKRTLVANGYSEQMIDVVRQAMPQEESIWRALGAGRQPGRAGDELTVGFFGSAYPHKGPSLLVEAAQRCATEVRVQIHGDAPEAFEQHLRSLDQRGVVELCGAFSHEQLAERLAGVDVAVVPSLWWDCAPLVVAECMAGGVPVLASRMGGIPDFVRDGVDGLLFDGRDADDLAVALDRLSSEPGLLEQLQAGVEPPRRFADYIDELERIYRGERAADGTAATPPVTVRWRGDQLRKTSLAGINREVCARLAQDGRFAVERVLRSGEAFDPVLQHPAEIEVRHQWPYDFGPSSARLAVIQPWEFGAIPQEWVEPIRSNVDEIWVPSEYVRQMYITGGVDPQRVTVVPNGVDLGLFRPDGPDFPLDTPEGTRFLFVGGLIERKGPDLLLAAYLDAFQGRDDVTLVIKDFGADTIYPGADRTRLEQYARDGTLPRIVYLHGDLSDEEMAALYRSCDVMVLPYRGEGFCMPALEAMASGLPVIVPAGGPTDEFVPDAACWRVPARRAYKAVNRVDEWVTASTPFMLEPDVGALRDLLVEAESDAAGRRARGEAGVAAAAAAYGWDAIARHYAERLSAIAASPPRSARPDVVPFRLEGTAEARLLATPAWRGSDRLGELLAAWTSATSPGEGACLYLLADRRMHGGGDELAARVMDAAAAACADLDAGADVTIVVQPYQPGLEASVHAAVNGFVRLHGADAGGARLAAAAGNPVLQPQPESLEVWLACLRRAAA
ncbi:MAG TPA: glycosyltransferase [Gaiellales bacterium]|nr:glycosyltransferase [Gaiellales bacterium]